MILFRTEMTRHDEVDEFDESSDEEADMTGYKNKAGCQASTEVVTQDELGRSTNFLLGTHTRYGGAIRINHRLFFLRYLPTLKLIPCIS